MPLIKIEQIKPERYIGIWHITEHLEDLLTQLNPNQKYLPELEGFRIMSKKLEWAAARLTVKMLAAKMKIDYKGIDKNTDGKPVLAHSNVEISLTHSYPFVAAIIDRNINVGIDLEQPKEKLKAIAHKFLSEKELLFTNNDVVKLCIAWCAKETLYKMHSKRGLLFKENLLLEPYEPKSRGIITGSIIANDSIKSYNLEYRVEKDYILTFTG
ncbi:MAG TPA: 4'-phosphopantetheinyl transferase superfamily protein [Fulvivirga sp.]|nr:4'-phosphopantetheinyl transferase superfamily protein [Fulvivirga sp.]